MNIKIKSYILELSKEELEVIQILIGYCRLGKNKHVDEVSRILDEVDNSYDFNKLSYTSKDDGLFIDIKE